MTLALRPAVALLLGAATLFTTARYHAADGVALGPDATHTGAPGNRPIDSSPLISAHITDARLNTALERSIPLLQNSADTWFEKRSCASCHHQGLGTFAMAVIRDRGHAVDTARLHAQAERTMRPAKDWGHAFVIRDVSINQTIGQPYRAVGALAAGHPGSDLTRAIALLIAGEQHESGRWTSTSHRRPLEDSEVTATALGVRMLSLQGVDGHEQEFTQRIAHARRWLEQVQPVDTEERVMQLLGLAWSGATPRDLDARADALAAEQRADGGWGQVPARASDAYATGQALVALQQAAGRSMREANLARGISYLLDTQKEDGSWHVTTRRTLQDGLPYFESGYPHGKDQFISYAGAAWASLALALAPRSDETHDPRATALMDRPRATFTLPADTMPDGLTPLHRAALFGTVSEVHALLEGGASVNDTTPRRGTPLMAAVHDVEKVRLLLDAGADPERETTSGNTAPQLAAAHSSGAATARLLMSRGVGIERASRTTRGPGLTAFAFALLRGDTVLAQELLNRGASVNGSPTTFTSPLMAAVYADDHVAAEWLLSRGARVDDRPRPLGEFAETPLMIAAEDGMRRVLPVLLRHGARLETRSREGLNPLHYAAAGSDLGDPIVLDALLAAGASPDVRSDSGQTPAEFARRYGKTWAAERLERAVTERRKR